MHANTLIVWLVLFAWCCSFPAHAEEERASPIEPPAPVKCPKTACDRDPKHLEQFVATFYEWYVGNLEEQDSLLKLPEVERKKRNSIYAIETKQVLNGRLTHDFLTHTGKVFSVEPGTYPFDPRYCPTETDVILCAQDWPKDWMHNASAQFIAADNSIALIIVKLPPTTYHSKYRMPHILSVRLHPEDEEWRIDGVSDLLMDYPNGGR